MAANVADEEDIKRLVEAHRERFGRLDVLVNNAGIGIGAPVADTETKKLDIQLDVNLRGVYLVAREGIPLLKEAGAEHGKALMVNTASIAGKYGQGWLAAYSATKFGVVGLSQALHRELSGEGIQVTAFCPGFVDTAMTDWVEGVGRDGDDSAGGHRRGGALPAPDLARLPRARDPVHPAGRHSLDARWASSRSPARRSRSSASSSASARSYSSRRRNGRSHAHPAGRAARGRGGARRCRPARPARGRWTLDRSSPRRGRCWPRASRAACSARAAWRPRPPAGARVAVPRLAKLARLVRPPLRWAASIGQTPPRRSV